jgi:predicted dehydrogenase
MAGRSTRRQFLHGTLAAGALVAGHEHVIRPFRRGEKLRLGVIGVGGRGADNLAAVAHEEIVALCDVDAEILGGAAKTFPVAKTYRDFRALIERGGLDAVVVSTPDHTHAPATALALHAGLHVYCEKPLTHSVHEARVIRELAQEKGVVTQMGTQIHAGSNYRRVVELVKSGMIGAVREVHVWVGGGYSGGARPTELPPVPAPLDWDLWLGPAPVRPYHPTYAPFHWRGWWDFGNGTLGDMACHHMDLPFWALDLRVPKKVATRGPEPLAEACPPWLEVTYQFDARGKLPPVTLTWYHGDRRPPQFGAGLLPEWGNGTLFVGADGMLIADYEHFALLPEARFADRKLPPPSIPESVGHHQEWIDACKGGPPPLCVFDSAGRLTEAVLLGCVSHRAGNVELAWSDGTAMTTGSADADRFLKREYRAGWTL